MPQINCPRCDQKIDLKHTHCPHCGESLESFAVRMGSRGMSIRSKSFIIAIVIVAVAVIAAAFFNATEYPQSLFFVVGCLIVLLMSFLILWTVNYLKN